MQVNLQTYKKYTKQEFLKWDEKYISVTSDYYNDYFYIPDN